VTTNSGPGPSFNRPGGIPHTGADGGQPAPPTEPRLDPPAGSTSAADAQVAAPWTRPQGQGSPPGPPGGSAAPTDDGRIEQLGPDTLPAFETLETRAEQDDDLPLEAATAYGIEGYDPDDPWNAVLCVENEHAVTVLPLTPKSLDHLVTALSEVRDAQRIALGVDPDDIPGPDEPSEPEERRPGALRQMTQAARFATGSASVARLWNTSLKGRMVIIGGAVLFVLLGFLASVFTR
jgi:hypothetical protein